MTRMTRMRTLASVAAATAALGAPVAAMSPAEIAGHILLHPTPTAEDDVLPPPAPPPFAPSPMLPDILNDAATPVLIPYAPAPSVPEPPEYGPSLGE
jgi:hypothetical protein